MKKLLEILVLSVAASVLLGACGAAPAACSAAASLPSVKIVASDAVKTRSIEPQGQILNFTADARPANVVFDWQLTGSGTLVNKNSRIVRYQAPASVAVAEEVTLTVTITESDTQCTAIDHIDLRLLSPASQGAPEPTAVVAIPTLAPTAVRLPASTSAPAPASEPPLGLNIRAGDLVAQSTTLTGVLPPDFGGDLWVFVATSNGLLYPQSPDACTGAGTPRIGARWELPVGFGGSSDEGLPFEIVLTRATPQGSQAVATTLQQWCQIQRFPGLEALPDGVSELQPRIRVTRSGERSMRPPPVTNASVPGQAAFTNLSEKDTVLPQKIVQGTYAGTNDGHIWVLVYAVNGRWYPQSMNACGGAPAPMNNGTWQVQAGFGGAPNAGEPFDVVLVLADGSAHQFFLDTLRAWCQGQHFPGLLTIELPPGLAEQARVRVVRK